MDYGTSGAPTNTTPFVDLHREREKPFALWNGGECVIESGKRGDTDRLKREREGEGGRRRTTMIRSTEVVKKECTKNEDRTKKGTKVSSVTDQRKKIGKEGKGGE